VDPVDRLEDQVAVRVDPRLLLGDPALVDEALHQRVVGGEAAQLAGAQQVAATVPDMADLQDGAVEHGGGDRRAGALELGM
jgi:hypothetical protein